MVLIKEKYIKIGLAIILLALVFFIVNPFLDIILSGAVLAYIFYPLYSRAKRLFRNKTVTSLIISILVLILIIVPSAYLIIGLEKQAGALYNYAKNVDFESEKEFLSSIGEGFNEYIDFEGVISKISNGIIDWATGFLLSLPNVAFSFFLVLFIMFYLFRDGQQLVDFITRKAKIKKSLLMKIEKTTDSIIFGNIIIAILQGVIGGLGLWALGITSPILWGLVMGFFSLVPFIGTAIVWLPASAYLIFDGIGEGTWIKGIILLIYGFLIIGGVDTVLKPILIGDKSNIHPVIVLIGVLGGVPIFGVMGVVLGPLILGIATTLLVDKK